MAYNWVSTLYELPALIKDWRWGLGLGLFLFIAGTTWVVIDLYRKYVWWAEPTIKLQPVVEDEVISNGSIRNICLRVINDEETEITYCYATVVNVYSLYGAEMLPIEILETGRLRWMKDQSVNPNCRSIIPPKSSTSKIHVATYSGNLTLYLCKLTKPSDGLQGVHIVKIRLDGKFNRRNIKPEYFDGYIYAINLGFTTDNVLVSTTIFEEGDWTKDKRIRDITDN